MANVFSKEYKVGIPVLDLKSGKDIKKLSPRIDELMFDNKEMMESWCKEYCRKVHLSRHHCNLTLYQWDEEIGHCKSNDNPQVIYYE